MAKVSASKGFRPISRHCFLKERVHDTYKFKAKPKIPALCPDCGALFYKGRWQWFDTKPQDFHEALCPACHRIRDRFPAGYLTLAGSFLKDHRKDIIGLVRNEEKLAKAEHPLKRIMAVEDQGESLLITTTDIHLARGIGEALKHAYRGTLRFHYNPEENLLRVNWQR